MAVRTLKAENGENLAAEIEKLKALKLRIQEVKEQQRLASKTEQKITPWDVQGAEKNGVQQVSMNSVL